jgi:Cysteine-rich CPCC
MPHWISLIEVLRIAIVRFKMRLAFLAIFVLLSSSCDRDIETKQLTQANLHIASFQEMNEGLLGLSGWSFNFASRSGHSYGMDSDSYLQFGPGGRVSLTEAGYAVKSYEGLYSIDDSGVIAIDLAKYDAGWPKMVLRCVDGKYLLFRQDDSCGFQMGGRAGAVETSEMAPFWPFALTGSTWSPPKRHYYPCPCCGYVTLDNQWLHEICLVCFWEDDSSIREGLVPKGALLDTASEYNAGVTLRQARANFFAIGACEPGMKKYVMDKEKRSQFERVDPKDEEIEQCGAGQTATRSESNSEGGDKPQPEAEGLSR